MSYSPKNPNGQATMANSEPVVIASNQSAIPVTDNAGSITVDGTVAVTGVSTLTEQQSQTTHLATIAGDTTDIETAVELLDDTVVVLGTDTYTEAASKGLVIGGVRRDADTTLVNTTNEFSPLQVDANGRLKVEAFSGETLPVSLASTTITGTVAVTQSGTWDEVGINDSGNSITVDQPTGSNLHTVVDSGTITTVASVTAIANALPAGNNNIGDVDVASVIPGTAATNLGKAIDTAAGATDTGVAMLAVRDDDLTTLTPVDGDFVPLRTDSEGAVWITTKPSPTEGVSTMNATSSDGATALTSTAQAIKASAGCVFGYFIYNPNATAQFVQFYNVASGSVTVGTTNPQFMLTIPAMSAANLISPVGIQFTTAISWAATSTAGGNGAPTTALDAVAWYK